METSHAQQEEVLSRARKMCQLKEPEIEGIDQVPIAFCNIDDLEYVLHRISDESLLKVIHEAAKPERVGWYLSNLLSEVAPGENIDKGDPLDQYMADVISWWPGLALGINGALTGAATVPSNT